MEVSSCNSTEGSCAMEGGGLINVAVALGAIFIGIRPTEGLVTPNIRLRTAQRQHLFHVEQQHVQQQQPIGPSLAVNCCRGGLIGGVCSLQMGTIPDEGGEDGAQSCQNIDSDDSGVSEVSKGIYGFDEEIIAKEALEAPFRKLRLVAFGVFAAAALGLGSISVAGLAGVENFKELAQNLPNPLIDLGVVGLSFYLWVEEVKTKRSALRLIEKRREEERRVPNRTDRRTAKPKKVKKNRKNSNIMPATDNVPAVAMSMNKPDTPTSNAVKKTLQGDGGREPPGTQKQVSPVEQEGGIFSGVRKTLEAVNQQSYYQALALNQELEDKGVLPRLATVPDPPGAESATTVANDEPPVPAGPIVEQADADKGKGGVTAEVLPPVVDERGEGKERELMTTDGNGDGGKQPGRREGRKKGRKRRK